jgi:hypothetical protein
MRIAWLSSYDARVPAYLLTIWRTPHFSPGEMADVFLASCQRRQRSSLRFGSQPCGCVFHLTRDGGFKGWERAAAIWYCLAHGFAITGEQP